MFVNIYVTQLDFYVITVKLNTYFNVCKYVKVI